VRLQEHFADPIRYDRDRSAIWLRQARAAPAGKIGAHDVFPEANVDLDEDPPTARSPKAIVIVERTADEATNRSLRFRVTRARRGQGRDLAVPDLGAYVFGEAQ